MKITTALQLFKLPVTGLVPETSTSAPLTPAVGQLWTDNSVTPRVVRCWDGTTWAPLNIYAGTTAGSFAEGNDARITGAVQSATKGVANGVATLDASVKVPYAQLPTGTAVNTVAAGDDARITGAQQVSGKNVANGYAGLDASTKLLYGQLPVSADGASTASTVVQATDTRLSNTRTPTDNTVTGGTAAGAGVKLQGNTIFAFNLNTSLTDGTAASKQIRALGTGATDAAAGNDARLSDTRTPTAGSVVDASVATNAAIAESKLALASDAAAGTASRRTLGSGATQAMPGNRTLDAITAPAAAVSFNTQRITNLAPSAAATDAVNRAELDAARQGYAGTKDPVRVITTTNVNLAAPGASLDGTAMAAGDRVLVDGQTDPLQNGIYVWNGAAAAMTRATDADAAGEVKDGTTVAIGEGTQAGSVYIQTATVGNNAPGVTVAQNWVQFTTQATYTGTTNRITVTGTTIDIAGTYVGQSSITTVGTITSGVWNGTAVGVAFGGTGATTAAGARTNLGVSQTGYAANLAAVVAGTPLTVTHNLGTQDVIAQIRDTSTNEVLFMDIINASANTVTVTSGVAFAAGALRAVVLPVA